MYVHVQRLSSSPIYSNSNFFRIKKKVWHSLCNALSDKLSLSNYYNVNGDSVSGGRYSWHIKISKADLDGDNEEN